MCSCCNHVCLNCEDFLRDTCPYNDYDYEDYVEAQLAGKPDDEEDEYEEDEYEEYEEDEEYEKIKRLRREYLHHCTDENGDLRCVTCTKECPF